MATTESNLPFVSGLGRALAVAGDATASSAALQNLLREFGWQVAVDDQQVSGLQAVLGFSAPLAQLRQLFAALEQENPDKAAIAEGIFQTARTLYGLITNLSGASLSGLGFPFDQTGFAEQFAEDLTAKLLDDYLQYHLPVLHGALFILGILDAEEVFPREEGRLPYTRRSIHWDRVAKAISDPPGLFAEVYGWNSGPFRHRRFLDALELLLEYAGVIAHQVRPGENLHLLYYDAANHAARAIRSLEVPLFQAASADFEAMVESGLIVLPIPPKGDGSSVQPVGFVVTPMIRGTATPDMLDDESYVTMEVSGSFATDGAFRVDIRPDGVEATLDPAVTALQGGIAIHANPPEPWIALGDAEGSHLAFLAFSAGFELKGTVGDPEFIVALNAAQAGGSAAPNLALVLTFANSDGFLREIFGSGQHRLELGLGVQWSSKLGLRFNGQAGFETQLPAHLELGPVTVKAFFISAKAVASPTKVVVATGAGFSLKLGPLLAVIDNVGLKLESQQRGPGEPAGTFGDLKLDFGFKPPEAIGLVLDGGGFKGGGFLDFEPEEERYSGVLELEFQDQFTLKAFALLNTRLPNGQSGFSLLIVISSEFTPIQLGFGFKLNGVGGLLGLNRTVKIEPLRTGLRDNTLSSILFPTDIIANADRILSDLRQIFPPQAGRFVFGPMAKITWGTPVLLSIDLGLVIEIPDPVRLVILGVVRGILPDENASILRLQVNFLGEINFEQQQLSFDATLFDSKLLAFTLTGDMALRLDWGAEANFLLTVGGFHPAYQPPPMNLPSIRRLTLALLQGDNPRLTLEMYFAVTSNTVQFGARLELYAAAWKFNVYGFLSFDVLFQFNPFYFVADITAMLTLRVGTSSIASIELTLTLEGPTPWRAKGTAKFRICWFFTLKIRFNKPFGEARNTTLPDLAVLPLLLAALSASDNWEGELPARKHRLESLKAIQAQTGRILVHPLGTLEVSQKVVPLNLRIDRLGSQRPSDAREFHIDEIRLESELIPNAAAVQESFAPAQFFDMNDEEKLASPSFKNFDSGVRIGEPERLHTAYAAARKVQYELKYIDSQRDRRLAPQQGLFEIDPVAFNTWTLQGAIAKSELSFARKRKSSLAPEEVGMVQESFAIVNTGDLRLFDETSLLGSERAALTRVNALIATNPALRGSLQVVPAFEANP